MVIEFAECEAFFFCVVERFRDEPNLGFGKFGLWRTFWGLWGPVMVCDYVGVSLFQRSM